MTVSTAGIAEEDGRYLIALRKPGTSIGERWEFPGGKVKQGETPEEALKREFKEELHVNVRVGELLCTGEFSNDGKEYILQAFRIEILDPEKLFSSEHQQLRWADIQRIQHLDFPTSDTIIVDTLKRLDNGA